MKQQHRVTLILAFLFVAAAASGGCAGSKKKAGPTNTAEPVASSSFAQTWFYPVGVKGDAVDRLYLRGDMLFVYTKNQMVYTLGSDGGDFRFFCDPEVSGGVLRAPVILGEHIVYPCGSTIDIFNKLGRKVRTITLAKPTRSGAVGSGKMIYMGLDNPGGYGVVASIDITQPYRVINWELFCFGAVTPTPALYDRVLFAGDEHGELRAVSEERAAVWPLAGGVFKTQGKFVSDIKADDFGVYAANTDSKLYCLDRQTGKIKWQFYAGTSLKTDPVITPSLVYQFVPGEGLIAIDKTTGDFDRKPRWIVKNAVQMLSEDQKNVYLRRKDNRLMAIDKASGDLLFLSHGSFDVFTTNLQSPIIYAAKKDGKVYAIHPVLSEGEVGHMVMGDFRVEPLAMR